MQAWMEGYESDIEYTTGYYREQEPDFLNLCLVTQGISPIDIEQGFTYCELGCGLGLTSLIMAANYPQGKFYAIDFNPSHITRARSIAAQAGLDNIVFLEKSFADVDEDSSLLPECDFIVLHGIFTWVSDENRQKIINICNKKLRSGGLVYNSYNTKPGWSLGEPIQKMMIAAGQMFVGSSVERFDNAVSLLEDFSKIGPRFFALSPKIFEERIKLLRSQNKNYSVHEYFNEGWRAFYFSEIADYLSTAKLEFVSEANTTAFYMPNLLPEKSRNFLSKINDKTTRELFKDVLLNTMFRKDIYLRGFSSSLDTYQQKDFFDKHNWALVKLLPEDKKDNIKLRTVIGEVSGKPEIYNKLLNLLEIESYDIDRLLKQMKISYSELIQALLFLYQEQIVAPIKSDINIERVLRLNSIISATVFSKQVIGHIALPYFKSAYFLNTVETLFYQFYINAKQKITRTDLIESAAQELEKRGLFLRHEGQELVGSALRSRLIELEKAWHEHTLPILIRGGALALS